MNFREGEYVVYAANEVCKYSGVVTKCFDGKNKVDYCMLLPVYSSNSAYYVPLDKLEEKVRHLLSKDELLKIINEVSGEKIPWEADRNKRKTDFTAILKSNDFAKIFMMLRTIYDEKKLLEEKGKKLFAIDERAFNEAERLVRKEFSIVLEMNENEVYEYIKKCFGN